MGRRALRNALSLAPTLCCLAAAAALAQAPGQPAGAAENLPIQIQADNGIEWQQNARVYIARGNATAIRGTAEVHADTLIAHYRDVKGANKTAAAAPAQNALAS